MTRPDLGAIAGSVGIPALLWMVLVALATMDGYPGAVCVTPVTWLTATNAMKLALRELPERMSFERHQRTPAEGQSSASQMQHERKLIPAQIPQPIFASPASLGGASRRRLVGAMRGRVLEDDAANAANPPDDDPCRPP